MATLPSFASSQSLARCIALLLIPLAFYAGFVVCCTHYAPPAVGQTLMCPICSSCAADSMVRYGQSLGRGTHDILAST